VTLELPSFAKINLDLRVTGVRPDGYHELRTVFQTLALHDTLVFTVRPGPFAIECDDPAVPADRRNLVWRAAARLWRLGGHRGDAPRGVRVRLIKRIPPQAGLGGGSANAAVALLALARLWALEIDDAALCRIGAEIGADVPFFLVGGTALGLGRGDEIYPLVDVPRAWVVIVLPPFGVATADAYAWYDADREGGRARRTSPVRALPEGWPAWAARLRNDLEPPVARRHPVVRRTVRALERAGAVAAAMSGSGSAVYGLFEDHDPARQAAAELGWRLGCRVLVTRTLPRADYARRLGRVGGDPVLAARAGRRIS
jgi:4-diphosphocytidyl-2-C-methyl-D-erythritol kinase